MAAIFRIGLQPRAFFVLKARGWNKELRLFPRVSILISHLFLSRHVFRCDYIASALYLSVVLKLSTEID